jgi:hypothetical protein
MKILTFWILAIAAVLLVLFGKWKSCVSIIDGSAHKMPWFWPCGTNRVADDTHYFDEHTLGAGNFYDKAHQDAGRVYGPIAVSIASGDFGGEVS